MEPSSLTVTPSGVPSPGPKVVPSGGVTVLLSPSLNSGLSILTSSPGWPVPPSYSGSYFSLSFASGSSGTSDCSTSTTTRSSSLPSLSLTTTTTLSPGLASSLMSTTRLPFSSISALPGPSTSTVVPSGTSPPVFGISTFSPGLPLSSFQSGFSTSGASGSSTVTVTSTLSFEPSG